MEFLTVTFPQGNGYRNNPEAILRRIEPHINTYDGFFHKPLGSEPYTVRASTEKSWLVRGILKHYGAIVTSS